jgi:signal transduction histidine kinase
LFVPFTQNRWTKKASILATLFVVQAMAHVAFYLFGILIGSNVIFLLDLLILALYLFYAFDYNRKDKANKLTRAIIAIIIFIDLVALVRYNSYYYLPLGYLSFLLYSDVVPVVLLTSVLITRFYLFKKTQQELEVIKATSLQKQLSETVIKTQEEEMKRISKDIHDELGSNLALLKIKLHSAEIENEKFNEITNLLNRTSASARAIAYNLMPPYFTETDFKMILFSHFNSLNERGDMKFDLHFSGEPQMSKEKELMIYRIIIEMALNCLKHSRAKNVLVEFITLETNIKIICTDDGTGIPPEATNGIGMQSIYSRASYLGGSIHINSGSTGTKIEISIPIKSE